VLGGGVRLRVRCDPLAQTSSSRLNEPAPGSYIVAQPRVAVTNTGATLTIPALRPVEPRVVSRSVPVPRAGATTAAALVPLRSPVVVTQRTFASAAMPAVAPMSVPGVARSLSRARLFP
jgi:hypothetical protein